MVERALLVCEGLFNFCICFVKIGLGLKTIGPTVVLSYLLVVLTVVVAVGYFVVPVVGKALLLCKSVCPSCVAPVVGEALLLCRSACPSCARSFKVLWSPVDFVEAHFLENRYSPFLCTGFL